MMAFAHSMGWTTYRRHVGGLVPAALELAGGLFSGPGSLAAPYDGGTYGEPLPLPAGSCLGVP